MKVACLLLVVMAVGLSSCKDHTTSNVACLSSGLQNGLIAFYPFQQGSLNDASANNNDLSNTTAAAPTADRNGNASCAYRFNSYIDTQFLTRTDASFLNNLPAFSISLWYEPNDTSFLGDYQILLSRGDQPRCPDRRGEWSLGLYDCSRAVFGHNNSVWANPVSNPFSCEAEAQALWNKWHHVVAVKNNDQYKLYFDGSLQESATGNANCTSLHLAQDVGDLFIGKRYSGAMDDIAIYNRELTQQEVVELFLMQPCCQ